MLEHGKKIETVGDLMTVLKTFSPDLKISIQKPQQGKNGMLDHYGRIDMENGYIENILEYLEEQCRSGGHTVIYENEVLRAVNQAKQECKALDISGWHIHNHLPSDNPRNPTWEGGTILSYRLPFWGWAWNETKETAARIYQEWKKR